jgi:hypothetical protein
MSPQLPLGQVFWRGRDPQEAYGHCLWAHQVYAPEVSIHEGRAQPRGRLFRIFNVKFASAQRGASYSVCESSHENV